MKAGKALSAATIFAACNAHAGSFDASGRHAFSSTASATESFEAGTAAVSCDEGCNFEVKQTDVEPALDGQSWVTFSAQQAPFDLALATPKVDASYRARAWVRHARVWARVVIEYSDAALGTDVAYLFPSGQVTSDGWVELVSNPFSISGSLSPKVFLRLSGSGVDLDAVELTPEGAFSASTACAGAFDPVCGTEGVCIAERCRDGARYVPPLPAAAYRESVAAYLAARARYFFGGKRSRALYLPAALAMMESMKSATTAWQYWSRFAHGVRLLNDWHTSVGSGIDAVGSARRLGVCFIEGYADLSQSTWPSQAGSADLLVSHVMPENPLGLVPGDRLVAVDGEHPLTWAKSLRGIHWGYHAATDPDVQAEHAEAMRGLIPLYAKRFSIVRCDATTLKCSDVIETIDVTSLPPGASQPHCDNRPKYHLENPPEDSPGQISVNHALPFFPWRDRVVGSPPGEDIYGMTWDLLYGTNQGLTPFFLSTNQFFKDNARGVILDHRAGNGGTLDAPQAITQLVRAPFKLAVGPTFLTVAGDDGPVDQTDALARFAELSQLPGQSFDVGSPDHDPNLPVALLIHRDGSASDFLPLGMKGAPKARVFGPHQTAGAFSSFYQFSYWSRLGFQLASGDTITHDGQTLIGYGVAPDVIVGHTQSALLEGRDLPFETALAWVRENLK